jgi:hypothetical protein
MANPAGLARIDSDPRLARQLLPRVSLGALQTWMPAWELEEKIVAELKTGRRPIEFDLARANVRGEVEVSLMRVLPFDLDGRRMLGIMLCRLGGDAQRAARIDAPPGRWQEAIEAAGDAIWDWDVIRDLVWSSGALRTFLGEPAYERREGRMEWMNHVHPDDRAAAFAAYSRVLNGEAERFSVEYRSRPYRGSPQTWLLCRGRATARDSSGLAERMVGTIKDVTARHQLKTRLAEASRQMEQRVAERTRDLVAANEKLQLFAAAAAHDIAGPLRSIEGFAAILRADHFGDAVPDAQQLLARIETSARRLGRLLESLNTLFRDIEDAPGEALIDVDLVARDVLEAMWAPIKERNAKVQLRSLPPCVGSESLVRAVFSNLIGNALKFTGERADPEIEIGCAERQGETTYYVRDNGIGFDMEDAPRMFEPLGRLHPQSRFEGSGVGLTLAARIVERGGGRIWAEGTPGQGATFYFRFGPSGS